MSLKNGKRKAQSISCRDQRHIHISTPWSLQRHAFEKGEKSRSGHWCVLWEGERGDERWRITHFLLASNDWHPKKIMTHERWIWSGYGPRKDVHWMDMKALFDYTIKVESSKRKSLFIRGGGRGRNKADCWIKSRGRGNEGAPYIGVWCWGLMVCPHLLVGTVNGWFHHCMTIFCSFLADERS